MNILDEVSEIPQIIRMYYACELKPVDWVVWDDQKQLWVETDEHFRKRVKDKINIPKA